MKKAIWMLLGFAFFFFGISALVLSFVGVQFSFMLWVESFGSLAGFIIKLLMAIGGVIIMYLTATDWKTLNEEL